MIRIQIFKNDIHILHMRLQISQIIVSAFISASTPQAGVGGGRVRVEKKQIATPENFPYFRYKFR
jgi:hypothetical protein